VADNDRRAIEARLYERIDRWCRVGFCTALGLGCLSLLALGVFATRAVVTGDHAVSSRWTVVAALMGSTGILLLSLAAIGLSIILLDLARNISRLREHADRHPAMVTR
jgi:protein-S-isoprenylcysteine O-methyltransferase Ste14